jgi:hypothetical protein
LRVASARNWQQKRDQIQTSSIKKELIFPCAKSSTHFCYHSKYSGWILLYDQNFSVCHPSAAHAAMLTFWQQQSPVVTSHANNNGCAHETSFLFNTPTKTPLQDKRRTAMLIDAEV